MSRPIVRTVVRAAAIAAVATAAAASAALAQGRAASRVPPGHLPPAGMCRIWVDGVPPGRQPAPMDCATAVRMRPRNARVLRGDDILLVDGRKPKQEKRAKGRGDRDDDDRWEHDDDDDDRRERERYPSSGECVDRNGDGRCDRDVVLDRPGTLPEMIGVILGGRARTDEQARWLGRSDVRARTIDADRDGIAERISWHDVQGRLVQSWLDSNRDGRADTVRVYDAGRLVRTIQ